MDLLPSPNWAKIDNKPTETIKEICARIMQGFTPESIAQSKEHAAAPIVGVTLDDVRRLIYSRLSRIINGERLTIQETDLDNYTASALYLSGAADFEQQQTANGLPARLTKGLLFSGSLGSGKSSLLKALKYSDDIVLNNGWTVAATAIKICNSWQVGGFQGLESYISAKVLLIDELGREPLSVSNFGTPLNVIQYVLQQRYDDRRVTHVTTNIDDPDKIQQLYGDYIASRFLEMFNVFVWGGDDRRPKLGA